MRVSATEAEQQTNGMKVEEREVKKARLRGERATQPAGEVMESVEVEGCRPIGERLAGHCGLCTTRFIRKGSTESTDHTAIIWGGAQTRDTIGQCGLQHFELSLLREPQGSSSGPRSYIHCTVT